MRKLLKYLLILFIGLGNWTGIVAEGAEDEMGVGYSVRAILPENQQENGHSFFDLRMTPGQKQTIQIEISNESDKEVHYSVELNDGITNNNVIIDYPKNEGAVDETLKYPFHTIAEAAEKISVPAKSKKMVDISLAMPAEQYDGIILGGIRVAIEEAAASNSEESVKIATSYTIGVILTETDTVVEPDLVLKKVSGDIRGLKPQFSIQLQNPQAINIQNLILDAKVYKEGESEVYKEEIVENKRVAPNSTFHYFVPTDGQPLEAGRYQLHLTAKDDLGNSWSFDEAFVVTEQEANTINEQAVGITVQNSNRLLYIALGILSGVILLLLIYLIVNRRKKT